MTSKQRPEEETVPPPEPVPPMPIERPTIESEHPHSTPGHHDPRESIDPELPPEPGHDINP